VCCGTKRLTEINCPPTCIYLESAHKHPAAAVRRQTEQDLLLLMGALGRVSEPQLQLFFLIQTFIARFTPETGTPVVDSDVADAAGAIASGLETASRGVVYEPQASSRVGEALRRELKALLDTEAAEVLRGIERGAKHEPPAIGAGPVAYLTLVARVLQERPPATAARSSLIIP
jgi:hypothetical protein